MDHRNVLILRRRGPLPGFLLSVVAAALPPSALAVSGAGASVDSIFRQGPGTRPAGMGSAFVSVADDENASAWNPAGLAIVPAKAVGFANSMRLKGISHEYVGYSHPIGSGSGLGGHISYVYTNGGAGTFEDSKGSLNLARSGGTFIDSDLKVNLSGATSVLNWVHLGAGMSYLQGRVDATTADGFGVDGGVLLTPVRQLSAGACVQNVGARMRGGSSLPSQSRVGVAYRWSERLLASVEADRSFNSRHDRYSVGLEGWVLRELALRAGFQRGGRSDAGVNRYSVGLGIRIGPLGLDYAFSPVSTPGDTHRIGLGFAFGQPRNEPEPGRFGELRPSLERAGAEGDPVETAFEKVGYLIENRRYELAIAELEKLPKLVGANDRRRGRYYASLERIYYEQGEFARAREAAIMNLKLARRLGFADRSVADSYAYIGLCLMREKKFEYASKFFEQALSAEPSPRARVLIDAALKSLPARQR